MSIGDFERLQHIPRNLEGYEHAQCCAHAQEKSEKVLISHLWLILKLYASRK